MNLGLYIFPHSSSFQLSKEVVGYLAYFSGSKKTEYMEVMDWIM